MSDGLVIEIDEDIERALQKLGEQANEIAKRALYEGAKIFADETRMNLERLPEDTFRFLIDGEKFDGVTRLQKQELLDAFGISKANVDHNGVVSIKLGFKGYSRFKTKTYPKGVPLQMLARSIESGSSVRTKTPFMRPARERKQNEIREAMENTVIDIMEKALDR